MGQPNPWTTMLLPPLGYRSSPGQIKIKCEVRIVWESFGSRPFQHVPMWCACTGLFQLRCSTRLSGKETRGSELWPIQRSVTDCGIDRFYIAITWIKLMTLRLLVALYPAISCVIKIQRRAGLVAAVSRQLEKCRKARYQQDNEDYDIQNFCSVYPGVAQ